MDLTENAKLLAPTSPFSIKISKGKGDFELYSMGNGLETSDAVHVEAVSSRARVTGNCLVNIGKANPYGNMVLYCLSVEVVSKSDSSKSFKREDNKGFFVILEDSGDAKSYR
jgi:hypothetical protein